MDTSIDVNNGNVIIGAGNVFICQCGGDCTSDKMFQGRKTSLKTNKVCLCPFSKGKDEVDSLVNRIVGVIHEKSCSSFELHLKLKDGVTEIIIEEMNNRERGLYKSSNGNSSDHLSFGECETCSPEFEVKLSHPNQSSLKINNSIEVTDVNPMLCLETNKFSQLQQLLTVSNSGFIQVRTKVDENGTKIRLKFHFDVKRSTQRRCHSFSGVENSKQTNLKKTIKKSNSFRSYLPVSTVSNVSLFAANSSITIGDISMDAADLSTITDEAEDSTTEAEDLHNESNSNADNITDEFDLERILEGKVAFANGQFGPLYKVTRKDEEILVKIVGDNPKFLEEAKQFCNCTHPFVRPTAEVLANGKRSYVMYRFVAGMTLYEAIQNKVIPDYITRCRILFGIVKGLCYLRDKQINCQFLTTEKVLLDANFNPRICGVGLAYFDNTEHASTNVQSFHRTLSYLDKSLRSSDDGSPKNVVWSVGRIIWEMLLGEISQNLDQDLLVKYNILEHLNEACDDRKIKAAYFSPELRRSVYAAGWPKDKEITKSLVVCAIRCMLLRLDERMSLNGLYTALQSELCDLQKREKFSLYQVLPDNQCIFCMRNERGHLALTCGCTTACYECLKNAGALYCPEHGRQFSKIGHPSTYGVLIQGDFREDQEMCENDANAIENLYTDQNIFDVKNFDRIKSKGETDACRELENVKVKMIEGKKVKRSDRYPSTLILFIVGHCNEAGNLMLPDKSILKKKSIHNFIRDVNMKTVIVLCNGFYSEKLVKYLSTVKSNFLNSNAFFGVFSHSGNLCSMSLKSVCKKHSITVRYILDILREGKPSLTYCSRNHLTVKDLIELVSERMFTECGRCLKPIERNGAGHIPVSYLQRVF